MAGWVGSPVRGPVHPVSTFGHCPVTNTRPGVSATGHRNGGSGGVGEGAERRTPNPNPEGETADIEAGVHKVNAFIEERVRERPAEWFWTHKRWPSDTYKRSR